MSEPVIWYDVATVNDDANRVCSGLVTKSPTDQAKDCRFSDEIGISYNDIVFQILL